MNAPLEYMLIFVYLWKRKRRKREKTKTQNVSKRMRASFVYINTKTMKEETFIIWGVCRVKRREYMRERARETITRKSTRKKTVRYMLAGKRQKETKFWGNLRYVMSPCASPQARMARSVLPNERMSWARARWAKRHVTCLYESVQKTGHEERIVVNEQTLLLDFMSVPETMARCFVFVLFIMPRNEPMSSAQR